MWGGPSAGTTLQYNGGSAISLNAGAWTDVVTSGGGTLSKLEINGGSIDAALSAIEIDGKTITNPFIYSADLYYDAQDPGNPASDNPVNWDSTVTDDVNINGANYAASTMFDTTNNHPQSPANNDCIIWRPRQEITVTNKVEVFIANGASGSQRYYVNKSYVGEYNTATLAGTWLTLAEPGSFGAPTFPFTLETLGLKAYANSSGGFVAQVRIDGQKILNGVNNSYGANGFHLDFSDPDDLGADSSGNGNSFTASGGFNTNPVGIFSEDLALELAQLIRQLRQIEQEQLQTRQTPLMATGEQLRLYCYLNSFPLLQSCDADHWNHKRYFRTAGTLGEV